MDDFSTLQSNISAALVSTTRSASQLAAEDLLFHRSLDARLGSSIDRQNARLLALATRLLGSATASEESVRAAPTLRDIDAVDGNWRAVVDVVDSLLERADTALDEFTGAVKRLSPGVEEKMAAAKSPARGSKIASQLKASDMLKPQLQFEHVPTNREMPPFKPLLSTKPFASVPLETEPITTEDVQQLHYPHPYQHEIEQFQYPASIYTQADPIPYHPFDSTTATFVDTEDALMEMLEELKQAKEIAIDLEHHDQRSYIGIVSLMQISTRDRDWIVDTLKPWRRKLQILNEVFANPSITKVLHGAHMDAVWLQRDLGLYLVGLFDTHYASRALGYVAGSLAFLLKKFANVDAQKQYQMADWRVRPLPKELIDYARSDTHYLLYIFDCMRNELIQRSDFSFPNRDGDKILHVLQKSSECALQRYEHPVYDFELGQGFVGWYKMLIRTPALLSKEQFSVFRAVHQWRDKVAREQDDSVHYVMPNHQIFTIARELPNSRAALFGIAQPISQTLRLRADELVAVIVNAKERGKDGPEMMDVLSRVEPPAPKSVPTKIEQTHALTEHVPKPTALVNGTALSALPLRSATSTFWGAAFDNSAHGQQKRAYSTLPDVSLAVPLPPLAAEGFTDPASAAPTPVRTPASAQRVEESAPSASQSNDEVFVIRELGKKRKRHAENIANNETDGVAAQSDEVAVLPDEEVERLRRKAEKRKAKKEAKRAAKTAIANEDAVATNSSVMDEEPFDYTTAPSILNPPREQRDGRKKDKKKDRDINPYAKALDTPKGLPRNPGQKERAGRSMTFK